MSSHQSIFAIFMSTLSAIFEAEPRSNFSWKEGEAAFIYASSAIILTYWPTSIENTDMCIYERLLLSSSYLIFLRRFHLDQKHVSMSFALEMGLRLNSFNILQHYWQVHESRPATPLQSFRRRWEGEGVRSFCSAGDYCLRVKGISIFICLCSLFSSHRKNYSPDLLTSYNF